MDIEIWHCLYLKALALPCIRNKAPFGTGFRITIKPVFKRLGANYQGDGPGILRKIPEEAMDEIRKIFEITGGMSRFEKLKNSRRKKLRIKNEAR